jgi:ClpP class serine protease
LTQALAAQHGGEVLCLAPEAYGKVFRLYSERPGAERVELVTAAGWRASRAASGSGGGPASTVEDGDSAVALVRIDGPLEQRAGFHDPCAAWTDGHDAVAERLISALESAPVVVLLIDSPGGAVSGLQESIRRVQEAKARTGGKIITLADETIASAVVWWSVCVSDEIYVPKAGVIGSIGCRAAHVSIAGALEKDGLAVTEFSMPEGKIALSDVKPLSKLGKSRGEREVRAIFEQFAADVVAHSTPERKLTRADIVKLDGDMLRGQDAVDAGLANGVATLESVMQYALDLASAKGDEPMATKPGVRAEDEKPEDEKKDKPEAAEPPPPPADDGEKKPASAEDKPEPDGDEKPAACEKCGEEGNPKDARYCKTCGEKMAPDAEEDKPEPAAGDEPPPDGDKKPESRAAATSYAGLLGLSADASHPAIKSALMAHVACSRKAMALTGKDSPAQATGALQAMADEAAKVHGLEAQVSASAKREEYRTRNDLLTKLAAAKLPGCSRGELFVDKVSADGKRTATVPAPLYATTPIETLRGFVDAKLANKSPRSVSNPFEPDASAAKAKSRTGHVAVVQDGELATNISARTGIPSDRVAGSLAALQESGAIAGEDR